MLRHYLSAALAQLRRFKLTTAINLACLALGLACVVLTLGTLSYLGHGDAAIGKAPRLFLITKDLYAKSQRAGFADEPRTGRDVGVFLRSDFPQLTAVVRRTAETQFPVSTGPTATFASVSFAEPGFLELFALPFLSGNAHEALSSPRSAVITARAADRLFSTRAVLGRKVRIAGREDVTITGVIGDIPRPTHLSFELLVSMDTLEAMRAAGNAPPVNPTFPLAPPMDAWAASECVTYVQLPADGSLTEAQFRTQLREFAERRVPKGPSFGLTVSFGLATVDRFYLDSVNSAFGGLTRTGLRVTTLAVVLACLVLLISCANYASLASALAVARTKEIGIRKIIGARRSQLILQHLLEAAMTGAIALLLVLGFSALLLPLVRKAGLDVGFELLMQPTMLGAMVLLVLAVAVVGGAYPAYVLSATHPADAIRGGGGVAGRFMPKVLAVAQFTAASFLLVTVAIIQHENSMLRRINFQGEPVLGLGASLTEAHLDFDRLRTRLLESSHIASVTGTWTPPINNFPPLQMLARSADVAAPRVSSVQSTVAYDFFPTLGIKLLAGRDFSREHGDDVTEGERDTWKHPAHIVIDAALARQLGWAHLEEAIGATLYLPAGFGLPPQPLQVIGVVQRRPLGFFGLGATSNFYFLNPAAAQFVTVRLVPGELPAGLADVESAWKSLAPDYPMGRQFLSETLEQMQRTLNSIGTAIGGLAVFALVIAALGLFGMAMHVSSRRMREIGIRKAVGAHTGQIVLMLLRDFSRPVIVANVIAAPLAFITGKLYLTLFVERVAITLLPFALSLIATLVVAWAVVLQQSLRAARVEPAEVLQNE